MYTHPYNRRDYYGILCEFLEGNEDNDKRQKYQNIFGLGLKE